MADETSLTYEDPIIKKGARDAIHRFWQAVEYEQELCDDRHFIRSMGHYGASEVLKLLLEGKEEEEIIAYLNKAVESFRTYRRQREPVSNPIRVFRKEPPDEEVRSIKGLKLIKTG